MRSSQGSKSTSMLAAGRLKIHSSCEATIKGFRDLVWDEKAQARGVDMYLKGGSGPPIMRWIVRDILAGKP